MDPAGAGRQEAARRPQVRAAPLVVSLMVSLVVSLRVGSREGDRARPGFSGRFGVPSGGRMGPGDGSRWGWQAGGGAAASGPSSAISGITNGIISGITKGGGGGRRSGALGFLRAAPWEGASPGPGSRRQPQNPILEHKARFYGVSVIFADPQNTSRACPVCGRVGERRRGPVRACPCGARMGRHAAAASIARRGVEFLEGSGLRGGGRRATPTAGPPAPGFIPGPRPEYAGNGVGPTMAGLMASPEKDGGDRRGNPRALGDGTAIPVSLDPTRAFLGIPQQIRDRLCDFPDCKVREHAAGRPGLNRGFPGSRRRAGDGKRRRGGEAEGRRPRALHAPRKRRERPT
jgi:hypothetical protein